MKKLLAIIVLALVVAGCGGADDPVGDAESPFADLESVRAIEQLDDQGRPYLSPWDVDPAVADLQQRAVDAGLDVQVTGVYDDDTLAVVMAFQYSQGLVPDGVVGPNTWDALADPQELPDDVDALTLVEIATVAIDSPSDAREMLSDLGLPPPLSAPGSGPEAEAPSGDDSTSSDDSAQAEDDSAQAEDDSAQAEDDSAQAEDDSARAGDNSAPATTAVVYLGEQQMELLDVDGAVIHRFPISSGRDGLTPIGSFKVQSKSDLAYSATDYPNITMRWMTRFNGGIGFHGIPVQNGAQLDTPLGVAPVSAGCVRMDDAAAKVVYDLLAVNADVIVQA
ncbi:MAG: L,D-transpeptidase family protein [Acidimicrobiia bacterium]|nr:L,D-transpeptidase family protein [Acidimicrobiia bacterium]